MFMGSFPFGGMLGSCRREGMCMLTLVSEKGKLIMLIKLAIAYGNKSVTPKHFQKQVVRLALVCFVCFSLPYLFSPLHHIKETIWQ